MTDTAPPPRALHLPHLLPSTSYPEKKAVARAALNECGQNIPNAEENIRVRYSLCQDVYLDLKTILGARSPFVLDTIAAFLNDEVIEWGWGGWWRCMAVGVDLGCGIWGFGMYAQTCV